MLLLKIYFDVLFGCGVLKAELRPAEVDSRFKKILRHNCGVAKKNMATIFKIELPKSINVHP